MALGAGVAKRRTTRPPLSTYPRLDRAAAFVCTQNRFSLPLFTAEDLEQFLAEAREES